MLRTLAWMSFFLVFCLTVVLTIPNAHLVELNYYGGSISIHLTILLLITLGIGIFLGIIFNLMWVWNLHRDHQKLKKLHKQTLRELDTLTYTKNNQDTSTQ